MGEMIFRSLDEVQHYLPNNKITWSTVLPRRMWRWTESWSVSETKESGLTDMTSTLGIGICFSTNKGLFNPPGTTH